MVRDQADCAIAAGQTPDNVIGPVNPEWRELLGPNMRLYSFVRTANTLTKPQAAQISFKILTGDDVLLDLPAGKCKGRAGSQFCATAELSTYVTRRLKVN